MRTQRDRTWGVLKGQSMPRDKRRARRFLLEIKCRRCGTINHLRATSPLDCSDLWQHQVVPRSVVRPAGPGPDLAGVAVVEDDPGALRSVSGLEPGESRPAFEEVLEGGVEITELLVQTVSGHVTEPCERGCLLQLGESFAKIDGAECFVASRVGFPAALEPPVPDPSAVVKPARERQLLGPGRVPRGSMGIVSECARWRGERRGGLRLGEVARTPQCGFFRHRTGSRPCVGPLTIRLGIPGRPLQACS